MKKLELIDLKYAYNPNNNILKGINMEFETGKLYAILGQSGGGKTTLLSLLGGLDIPTGGDIKWNGESIAKKALLKYRKEVVAFIFQNYNLIDYLTAEENVRLATKNKVDVSLEEVGINKEEAKRNVLKLSGGQQQRVAVARALASKAEVILADEPTGNLDKSTADGIVALLQRSAHELGKCVIVVTHSKELAVQADVVLQLEDGILKKI